MIRHKANCDRQKITFDLQKFIVDELKCLGPDARVVVTGLQSAIGRKVIVFIARQISAVWTRLVSKDSTDIQRGER